MNIAIYSRHIEQRDIAPLQQLVDSLHSHRQQIWMPENFMKSLDGAISFATPPRLYSESGTLPSEVAFLLSIGGDGTLLSSVHLTAGNGQPVLGINFGHLGFLTAASKDDVSTLVADLIDGNYSVENRSLLQVGCGGTVAHALNEVTLHRGERSSLLSCALYVEDDYVATYVADGLIVATPTGSTAYSLSCGGPILTPDSNCFVVTPIGAHTLTLRPIIIHDTAKLRIETPPGKLFSLGIDSQSLTVAGGTPVTVRRAAFSIPIIRLARQTFFTAIREKLNWGK